MTSNACEVKKEGHKRKEQGHFHRDRLKLPKGHFLNTNCFYTETFLLQKGSFSNGNFSDRHVYRSSFY